MEEQTQLSNETVTAEIKPWWASKAIWGAVVAVMAGLAGILGYTIGPDDQETISGVFVGLASAVGGVIAVWGRVKATKSISSK